MTVRPVGVVDPRLFGGVLDETSPWCGPGGTRADLFAAVRDLGVTSVRWVAGVDPDQFMAWCSSVGAEPVLRLDLGTDTLDEALAWARDGVRYLALGQDLPDGADPELYVARARGWAEALRMAEPGISLISCGHTGMDDWDRVVIDGLARYVDFHGVHLFTGSADYWTHVLAPHYAERALSVAGALIDRARYVQRIEREISVAYDAWNVSLGGGRLEERYNLADALAVATYLNVFVRQSWTVRMASLARLLNVTAPIVTFEGIFRPSIYHPFQLMAAASLPVALDTFTDSGTHAHRDRPGDPYRVADLGLFQLLDVAATRDPGCRRLTVSVVNRALTEIDTRVQLVDAKATGVMTVHEVTADSPDAVNTFAHPDAIGVQSAKREVDGEHVDVTFSPHSFTLLEMHLA